VCPTNRECRRWQALLPHSLDDFIRLALPELRRRGLFRSEYEGRTLPQTLACVSPFRATRAGRQRPDIEWPHDAFAASCDKLQITRHDQYIVAGGTFY
jgi:hypothetical protein